mgnify:CR=1 FL=1
MFSLFLLTRPSSGHLFSRWYCFLSLHNRSTACRVSTYCSCLSCQTYKSTYTVYILSKAKSTWQWKSVNFLPCTGLGTYFFILNYIGLSSSKTCGRLLHFCLLLYHLAIPKRLLANLGPSLWTTEGDASRSQ